MKKIPITVLIFVAAHVCAQPQTLVDKVAGIVDNRIVLLSDVEAQFVQYSTGTTQKVPESLKCAILDNLLTQKLLVAQADIDSITVGEDEVEQELDSRIRYFASQIGSLEKLEEYYGKSIIEIKEEFRTDIREQSIAAREKATITEGITITPSEIGAFFNKIPKDSLPYFNTEYEVGELTIHPKVSKEMKDYAKQKITDLLNRVRNGESFSTLAAAYSQDPGTAENGGELGFQNRDELDPAFASAAFRLKNPNEVSDVIESAFGFHIIQLIERRGDRINVRHILIIPKITSHDLTVAGQLADSVYDLLQAGKITFEQAVSKFSDDETTKNSGGLLMNSNTGNNHFEVNDLGALDASLVTVTDTMQVGSVSSPSVVRDRDGTSYYRIVYLKSKTKPHIANMRDDYDKIQQYALSDKQQQTVLDWLEERIAKSYVLVAPDYRDCDEIKKWINKEQ